jgi:hypothetical protein
VVNAHLPAGYRESVASGMTGWAIPLEDHPNTYNGQPLSIAGLASQKRLDQLPLDVLGRVIEMIPPATLIERYEASRAAAPPSGAAARNRDPARNLTLPVTVTPPSFPATPG